MGRDWDSKLHQKALSALLISAACAAAVWPASGHAAEAASGSQSITGAIGSTLAVVPPPTTTLNPPASGETATPLMLATVSARALGMRVRTSAPDGRPVLASGTSASHSLAIETEGAVLALTSAGVSLEPVPRDTLGRRELILKANWELSDFASEPVVEVVFEIASAF
jgi:hypothetical protein